MIVVGSVEQLENMKMFDSMNQIISIDFHSEGVGSVSIDMSLFAPGIYFLKSHDKIYKVIKYWFLNRVNPKRVTENYTE